MCREARESRGNMSICCCDWQHFSQIYPARPAGSQEESGEKGKGGERDFALSLSLFHTHTHTHSHKRAQADRHKKEQLCTVSWQVNSIYYTCFRQEMAPQQHRDFPRKWLVRGCRHSLAFHCCVLVWQPISPPANSICAPAGCEQLPITAVPGSSVDMALLEVASQSLSPWIPLFMSLFCDRETSWLGARFPRLPLIAETAFWHRCFEWIDCRR